MLRSSAFWRSASTPITPPDKASRRSFATRSSRKSGARSSASITQARARALRRRDPPRRRDDISARHAAKQKTKNGSGAPDARPHGGRRVPARRCGADAKLGGHFNQRHLRVNYIGLTHELSLDSPRRSFEFPS